MGNRSKTGTDHSRPTTDRSHGSDHSYVQGGRDDSTTITPFGGAALTREQEEYA